MKDKIYIVATSIYYEGTKKPSRHNEIFYDYDSAFKVYNGMIKHRYFNPFISPKIKQKMIRVHLYGLDKHGKSIHEGEKMKELIML